MPFMNFLVHSYTCGSDRHASPYWTFIHRWISVGFTAFTTWETDDRMLFFFGACCKRGRHIYTTTAPSCCIPASYCHLSTTLQTISIIVVNLLDNRAVFRIFIALLRFSFDSPSYKRNNEARSLNHCCSGKAVSIAYCECVFVAFGIQHAKRMRNIVICCQPACTNFFSKLSKNGKFFFFGGGGWKLLNTKCVFDFLYTIFVWIITYSRKNSWRCYQKFVYAFLHL